VIVQPLYSPMRVGTHRGDFQLDIGGCTLGKKIHALVLYEKDILKLQNLLASETGTQKLKDWVDKSLLTRFEPR